MQTPVSSRVKCKCKGISLTGSYSYMCLYSVVTLLSNLLPTSIAFLAFISFARLAISCACSQATIMIFQESSIVLWKQRVEMTLWNYISWQRVLNCARYQDNPHQSEFFQDRMLPHGVTEDVLHQRVVLSLAVTFGDAHCRRFLFPWGRTWSMKQLQGS